jgi:hypothetical protein
LRLCILSMAGLLTLMDAAIKGSITFVSALECARPYLFDCLAFGAEMCSVAFNLLNTITAQQVVLYLPAEAFGGHPLLACSAQTFVAGSRAGVFAARHELPTDLGTTPA